MDAGEKSKTSSKIDAKIRGSAVEGVMEGIRHARRRLLFWNVAGMINKDIDFWDYIKVYDYRGLCETWVTICERT